MAAVTAVAAPTPDRQSREGWLEVLLWAAALLGCGVYGYWNKPLEAIRTSEDLVFAAVSPPQTLLGLVIKHWLLIALLVLLILIVAKRLGVSLGLPALFRDTPLPLQQDRKRKWDIRSVVSGAAFWGGVGATLLVGHIWSVIYYSELTLELGQFSPGHFGPGSRSVATTISWSSCRSVARPF